MYRVLFVDDEPDLRELAARLLGPARDLAVTTADGAPGALGALAAGSFDAVVSDYRMPGMDGLRLLGIVRERYGDLPFLLFTGRGDEAAAAAALNAGADGYLIRGGDPAENFAHLALRVREAVEDRRANAEIREAAIQLAAAERERWDR